MKKLLCFFSICTATTLLLIACGGAPECAVGEIQCSGMQVQTCGEDGTWGAPEDCAMGTCMDMGNGDECMSMGDDDDSAGDDDDSAGDDDDSAGDDDDSAGDDDDSAGDDDDSAN